MAFLAAMGSACGGNKPPAEGITNTGKLEIGASGSLQNPAWSPDGQSLLITRFRDGYNDGPADLLVVDIQTGTTHTLVSDGNVNVNLPGSVWNAETGMVVFSSSRGEHDEIYQTQFDASPGDETQITDRGEFQAYEPALSPDASWVVFESHPIDVEENGVITRIRVDGSGDYETLTAASDDCRQPNWSPDGRRIAYQRLSDGQWNLWVVNPEGDNHRQITFGAGNKTDVSFSADSAFLIYSGENPDVELANLYRVSISDSSVERITNDLAYDGAPSISPDGSAVAYESVDGDPDSSSGTDIWLQDLD